MRQVISTDLSDEQEDILIGAPLDGVILISGPPGSGKTVMAFHRAEALATKFDPVNVVMYNTVLSNFSNNATKKKEIQVKTMHSWFYKWGYKATRKKVKEIEPFKPDYKALFDLLLEKEVSESLDLENLNWGHVVIDEAQDFSTNQYEFLNKVRHTFFSAEDMPSVTVLADENQQLWDDNSSLKEIKNTFKIERGSNLFGLTKNYRNTDQINSLIEYFYVGLETGMTKPSGKQGELPELVFSDNFARTVKYIARYAKKYQNQEIVVIVPGNYHGGRYYEALDELLIDSKFNVQRFQSGHRTHTADSMDFDKEGTISILNKASCKGLEFDAVFIPELSSEPIDNSNLDKFKMSMYVMCSRARLHLSIFVEDENSSVLKHLPDKQLNILEHIHV